ncbi:hypothetical protein LZ30DRAFT_125363 [Colletotrichum cereale]|nr:hypothetical protein LZ30DRAFT_125363 [Colletotrichum cereale]
MSPVPYLTYLVVSFGRCHPSISAYILRTHYLGIVTSRLASYRPKVPSGLNKTMPQKAQETTAAYQSAFTGEAACKHVSSLHSDLDRYAIQRKLIVRFVPSVMGRHCAQLCLELPSSPCTRTWTFVRSSRPHWCPSPARLWFSSLTTHASRSSTHITNIHIGTTRSM